MEKLKQKKKKEKKEYKKRKVETRKHNSENCSALNSVFGDNSRDRNFWDQFCLNRW